MSGSSPRGAHGSGAPLADAVPVPAQDLRAHHAPLLESLQAATMRVLASGRYIHGGAASDGSTSSEVQAFEKEAATAMRVAHAVGLSSGTDALLAMLMAAGVGAGDEVVTSAFSFVATASTIVRLGARPVFVDIEPTTFNLDPTLAVARIGPRTRAVLTVHLFGRVAHSSPLASACVARAVPLLEDAAQAIGATDDAGVAVGSIGLGAALSFFPTKNLGGVGDGGMVLTNDDTFATRVRLLRAQGATEKFHHVVLGGNFRLDELQAALLRVKLPHLPAWTAARRRVAALYRQALASVPVELPRDDQAGAVWNQFVIRVPEGRRDLLAAYLRERRIATAVYYPEPLHLQPCFAALGHTVGDFPVAERACAEVLALPIYPELTDSQIAAVTGGIRAFFS